ncbi:MAG: hypothetical protein ABSA59_03705 [Terriglobia bacterium]|jgi:hypothetical protein
MKLANLTKKMRAALSIIKLVNVFDVYDSVETAVKSSPQVEPTAGAAPTQS